MHCIGDVIYHIWQPTLEDGLFSVSNNGSLTITKPLDNYAEGSMLNFTVYAVDTGGEQDDALVYIIIPATTVINTPTADNTIQYYTFFTYAPNMAWFVPLMMLTFGASCVVIHTIATCECPKSKSKP